MIHVPNYVHCYRHIDSKTVHGKPNYENIFNHREDCKIETRVLCSAP